MTAQSLSTREPATEHGLKAASDLLEENKHEVWFELVNVLDNKSINFVRKYQSDGRASWRALQERLRSSEKPRIQSLHQGLLKMEKNL